MGNSKAAAIAAALLAVVLIAIASSAGHAPDNGYSEQRPDEPGIRGIQTRRILQGQAWATELFGRRYGRNLLAAVAPYSEGGDISA
jgi:hypothetical protein